MATETAKRDFAPILNAVQQWIKTCLIGGGSIFSTEKIWSSQYIGELKAAFIDHPDVGKDSFRTKLKGQLQNASPQAKHLAAEMLWAILAFPTNINQSTKRDQIREVWSFSGALLPDNHPMLSKDVLAGIGSGGTAYNNLRDRELAFLIHVATDLYQRTPSERERLLSNYDAFLEWITPLAKGENRQFRHMLRYFAFPDRVERMSSNRERQAVLAGFGVASEKETRNWSDRQLDDALLSLRAKLQGQYPGKKLDFYEDPLDKVWYSEQEPQERAQDLSDGLKPQADISYWKIAPGDDAWQWADCRDKGFIAVGWDEIGDLSSVTRAEFEARRDALIKKHPDWKKRGLEQLWKFIGIQQGDRIVANRGTTEVLGIGTVTGPYSFVPGVDYGHRFPVHWDDLSARQVNQGGWRRTLIELDQQDFEAICNAPPATPKADQDNQHQPAVSTTPAYWWLNANPKIWDFRSDPVGAHQTYTSHNDKGNKRRIYEYFQAVKPGDLLLGYITSPDKEIVALCRITKPLHTDPKEGEVFEFEKIEQLKKPVSWSELQSIPTLANCEPLLNNQGSLFRLTQVEFGTIRKMTEAPESDDTPQAPLTPFTEADALQDLFIDKPEQLKVILSRLRRKKALILQGPPGVGKTFVARRIAYALMGYKDDSRVHMVQFHPSYGYEDFVQGYRPTRAGSLERRNGVFYEFARSARNDPRSTWVFIIDEINRGNLAKIFGELLMLLEADKRGPRHSVSLTYSEKDEEFYLPENLFVIGTMNTADRSLAMVDYALRRRFAFATLGPALDTDAFAAWFLQKGASKELLHKIRSGIGKLNSEITKERDLGEGFCIGHSFFCPAENEKPDNSWYSEIIDSEIKPLLKEYFESPDRVDTLTKELLQ
jgi:5-methylcytosine-specific restriction protein B